MAKRFSKDQVETILDLYKGGESTRSIAASMGRTRNGVTAVLRRYQIPIRDKPQRIYLPEVKLAEIKEMWESGKSRAEIRRFLGIKGCSPVNRLLKEAGIDHKGEIRCLKTGGRLTNAQGYSFVWVRPNEPFACMRNSTGYVAEHRLVMAKKLGRPLTRKESVHHKDGDRQNNDPSNLQLRQRPHGRGSAWRCRGCGSHDVEPVEI